MTQKKLYTTAVNYYDGNGFRSTGQTFTNLEQAQREADFYNLGADYSFCKVVEVVKGGE